MKNKKYEFTRTLKLCFFITAIRAFQFFLLFNDTVLLYLWYCHRSMTKFCYVSETVIEQWQKYMLLMNVVCLWRRFKVIFIGKKWNMEKVVKIIPIIVNLNEMFPQIRPFLQNELPCKNQIKVYFCQCICLYVYIFSRFPWIIC